ncbi:MAG: hypothetical protein CMC81_01275 [Flavobacteriaceae bacterium]|nr:hypothetical protein [Flavobacteriaceae bacterium]|tara:strand:+ start:1234 stop:1536 length:303 start_codon:yes stop_codon:yes gene_type:complete
MNNYEKNMSILESKIILLLNKLKENHLELNKISQKLTTYEKTEREFKNKLIRIKKENDSLKISNSLSMNSDSKVFAKRKINKIIDEIDKCIFNLSDINMK